jgi:hypothetical protein
MIAALLVAAATSPFGLTASPTVVHAAGGHTAQVRIYDVGTEPLEATVSIEPVAKVNGQCTVSGQSVQGVTLASPVKVHLNPGKYATATVRIAPSAPAQDLAVVFTAATGQAGGNVQVNGAVGTQLLVNGPHTASTGCTTKATPALSPTHPVVAGSVTATPGSRGWPWPWIIGALAIGGLSGAAARRFNRAKNA